MCWFVFCWCWFQILIGFPFPFHYFRPYIICSNAHVCFKNKKEIVISILSSFLFLCFVFFFFGPKENFIKNLQFPFFCSNFVFKKNYTYTPVWSKFVGEINPNHSPWSCGLILWCICLLCTFGWTRRRVRISSQVVFYSTRNRCRQRHAAQWGGHAPQFGHKRH